MDPEKEFITRVGKILSRQKNPDRHTLVSVFKPDSDQARDHGIIYIVMEIISGDPTMGRIAKLIEKLLIDKYYENLEDGLASFEVALKTINEKLSDLADDGEIGWIGKINSVIAILEKDVLHITQTGTTEAYMIRDGKIIHITENLSSPSEKPNPLKTFINIVSGNLKLHDKVVISTSELFYHFSLDDIRRVCAKFSPAIAASYIVKMLRREEIESINTLILELDEKEKDSRIEEIGKKILSTSEQTIVEGYKNIVPFWRKFLKLSKKGIDTSIEKSKDIYGNKIAPSVTSFAKEASSKVNERIEKISETKANVPLPKKKTKAERGLSGLTEETTGKFSAKGKMKGPQQNLFENTPIRNKVNKTGKLLNKIKSPVFMILGILLIVLLTTSGLISYQKKSVVEKRTRIENEYNALKTKVESAIKANELGDSKKAQSLLDEARVGVANFSSSTYLKAETEELGKKIEESFDGIFKISRLDDASPLADFKKLDETIKLTNVFKIANKVYVLDKERHKAAVYNYDDQTTSSLDNLSFDGEGKSAALLSDRNSIALLTNNPAGIYVYNSQTNSTEKASQITDEAWPEAVSISSYLNNIYLLVPSDKQVYKYSSLVSSYSNKSEYIVNADSVKIEDAVDMAIDGNVYLLLKTGDVIRFLSGEKEAFMIKGMPAVNEKEKDQDAKMITPIRLMINDSYIYVADSGAKRIVVFEKESGQYFKQYTSSKWTDIKDMWLDSGKLYLLSGSEVFEIEPKV